MLQLSNDAYAVLELAAVTPVRTLSPLALEIGHDLCRLGYLCCDHGVWTLTDLGRAALVANRRRRSFPRATIAADTVRLAGRRAHELRLL